ncbi:MAG: sodium/proline symporter [Clostridiales bacterium]|jgi:sodium/proline symporter|nr:sodium/proline symporter [Clostridiales bacterium]MDK2933055.1 sodium/proline symporter [Clostridiales bacterium]
MITHNFSIIITFILYLGLMLTIGFIFYQKTEKLSDYILGGRQLNYWVTSLSAQASDMSGWLLLGLPGLAYATGVGEAFWVAFGLAFGTYLNWRFIAKRLRKYTHLAGNSLTLPDYFENRFKDHSKVLRVVSAIFILIFFLIYTAAQFAAGAKLFNTVFGVPYLAGLAIGAFVIISYTFLGGFMAVCWTDFFQGLLMFFAIITVPIAGMMSLGGIDVTFNKLSSIDPLLLDIFAAGNGKMLTTMAIISSVAWGLGYFGQPHILVRFMAIRSSNEIKQARTIAIIWVTLSLAAAVLVGVVGRVYLTQPLEGAASETVFMVMVNQIFPSVIAGMLLAAILAATMSTADSQLLVTSSAISGDFYKALFRKNASDKELVWVGRLTVVGVSIIAYLLAINPNSSVFKLVAYAWAGFGAAFGPTIILSLFWKRMTRFGALAGMVGGGLTVLIWKQLQGGLFDLYEIVPGFIISVLAIIIVSLMDKEPAKEIIDEFEAVNVSEI